MARSFQHVLDLPSGSGHDISQEIADHWCAMCYQMLSPILPEMLHFTRDGLKLTISRIDFTNDHGKTLLNLQFMHQ